MKRRTLLATGAVALTGCVTSEGSDSKDTVIYDEERATCSGIRFDLEADETIVIDWEILERGPEPGDTWDWNPSVEVRIETVADGTVDEWELPYEDVEGSFRYTAERSAEHYLDCSRVGDSHITIRRVDDA